MYRELTSHGVELRVWTGDEWHWMHCRLYGKEFPEDGQLMSPSVVYEHPYTMLQVPVKEVVQDASGMKERISGRKKCLRCSVWNERCIAERRCHRTEHSTEFVHISRCQCRPGECADRIF